ncbi:DUF5979 domain-containing protein [Comamonas humi]
MPLVPSHAATISLATDGHYFDNWTFSTVEPAGPVGYQSCTAAPPNDNLPLGTVIQGAVGRVGFEVTATSASTYNWEACPWYYGASIPTGNGLVSGTSPGSVNYTRGDYDIKTLNNRPLPYGSLLAFQDMDGYEMARLSFYDCQGQPVDSAGFDTLIVSSSYAPSGGNGPLASTSYDAAAGQWLVQAGYYTTGTYTGVPNVTTGLVMKAANVCRVHIQGPTQGTSGGVTFYLGSPPVTSISVNTSLTGGPTPYTTQVPLTAQCTVGGTQVDVSGTLTPSASQPGQLTAGQPASITFDDVPVGAVCTITAGGTPGAPDGYTWGTAPGPVTLTAALDPAGNQAAMPFELKAAPPPPEKPAAKPVPALGWWGLLALVLSLGGLGWLQRRRIGSSRP